MSKEEIFKQIDKLKISQFLKDGFKGCYYDFLKRGVGYIKTYDIEQNLVLTKDLKELHFKVVDDFEGKVLLKIKPSKELIKIYEREFLT